MVKSVFHLIFACRSQSFCFYFSESVPYQISTFGRYQKLVTLSWQKFAIFFTTLDFHLVVYLLFRGIDYNTVFSKSQLMDLRNWRQFLCYLCVVDLHRLNPPTLRASLMHTPCKPFYEFPCSFPTNHFYEFIVSSRMSSPKCSPISP